MTAALFASASPETIRQTLVKAREFFGDTEITVYVRSTFVPELKEDLEGLRVESDHLRGRLKEFLREVRERKYDDIAVIWGGDRDHWKLKAVAVLAKAPHLYVFNENGGVFQWGRASVPIVFKHMAWRMRAGRAPSGRSKASLPLRLLVRAFSATVGPVLGFLWLLVRTVWFELRRLFNPRRKHNPSNA